MAPRVKQAWTPSAEVPWYGELPDDFRAVANEKLGARLSDEAWVGLGRVTHIYAMDLGHEYTAAPLGEQIKAIEKVYKSGVTLSSAINAAETLAFGRPIRNIVSEEWEQLYDHVAEFDRNQEIMVADLTAALGNEEDAWSLMRGWMQSGRLVRPEPAQDFLPLLDQFVSATHRTLGTVMGTGHPTQTQGDAFQEFIGRLYEWKDEYKISGGVSKQGSHGHYGKLVELVKAILNLVPVLRDHPGGKPEPKQIRRPVVSDATLADAIIKARQAYEAARPK